MPNPIVAAVGGSLVQGVAANKAAKAQTKAADAQVGLQREIYNDQKGLFRPFYDAGTNALNALNFELGLGARPTFGGVPTISETVSGKQPAFTVGGQTFNTRAEAEAYAAANATPVTEYGGYTKTPGYEFRLNEGLDAVQSSAAARGSLNSGATLRDLLKYGQDYATSEYGTYLNRLGGMTDMGAAAAGQTANAGSNFAAGASNALGQKGNAQAAGAIGMGNALNSGIGNVMGYMQYSRSMQNQGYQPNKWGFY